MTGPARVRSGLAQFWAGLITEPIARGRLRDTGWPVGLRPIVVVGTAAFGLAVLLILISPIIRAVFPLSVSMGEAVLALPRIMLPAIFWLIMLSVALLQTAALHTRLRTTIVLTTMASLVLLFIGGLDLGANGSGGVGVTAGKVASVIAVLTFIALVVVRRRRAFAWWEFPVVLAVSGLAAVIALGRSAEQTAPFGIDFGPTTASLVMSSIGQLAVPAALAAGVAVAEFAISASTSAVGALQRPAAGDRAARTAPSVPRVLIVAFVLVALWRVVELAVGALWGEGSVVDPVDLPVSAGLVVAVALVWWGIARLRRRGTSTIDDVMARLDDVGLPVAVALTVTLAPVVVLLLMAQVLVAWGVDTAVAGGAFVVADLLRGTVALTALRVLVAIALLVAAVVAARRGRRGLPELLAVIALVTVMTVLPALTAAPLPWSYEAIAVVVAVASIAFAAALAVRRRLDERRVALLTIALLLSAATAWRDVLADPLSVIIGASGIALVLFGFIWGFLTDADVTHGESAAYPRPARIMLFLANAVFGVTVLAFGTLARSLDAGIDLDGFAQFGDELLGTALILAAVMAVWAGAAAAQDSADSRPGALSVAA